MLQEAITILQQAGFDLTAREIAEIFWLAVHLDQPIDQSEEPQQPLPQQPSQSSTVSQDQSQQPPEPSQASTVSQDQSQQPPNQTPDIQPDTQESPLAEVKEPGADVYLPFSKPKKTKESREAIPIKVPAAVALRNSLALGEALSPLNQKVPSAREKILDEEATVYQIAESNIWLPILKPASERWLDLALVVEKTSSTAVWKQTIIELQHLVKHLGAFRDVRTWELRITETKVDLFPQTSTGGYNSTPYPPRVLIDPNKKRLILLVSDCISVAWRTKLIHPVLEFWGRNGLLTILQLLPERLWERTALGSEIPVIPVKRGSPRPEVFNRQLIVKLWDKDDIRSIQNKSSSVNVPVVTLEPYPLLAWSQVIAGQGNLTTVGFNFGVADSGYDSAPLAPQFWGEQNSQTPPKLGDLGGLTKTKGSGIYTSIQQRPNFDVSQDPQPQKTAVDGEPSQPQLEAPALVSRFRATASPMARRLAGLMAAAPVSLPVVQLIQQTLLPKSAQIHVAEVFMSGLLQSITPVYQDSNPDYPDYIEYEFRRGVRELLVDSVPISKTLSVIDKVSEFIANQLGLSVKDFEAYLLKPATASNDWLEEKIRPFAQIKAEVLGRLGGEYARLAEQLLKNEELVEEDNSENNQTAASISESPTSYHPSSEDYLQFLEEVLQATDNSKVVYPLLEANLDKLDDNLIDVLQTWASDRFSEVESETKESIARVIEKLSNLIRDFTLGNKASNIEIAIAGYEQLLTVFTREAFPVDWAETQNHLGLAYRNRIKGEKAQNIEEAIAFCQQALIVYTFEAFPMDWATTQNNLGVAYLERIKGEKAQNIEEAIACYQQALRVTTFEAFPIEWATTQTNLGLAYHDRIKGEKAQNIEEAIACCQQALRVYTFEAFPMDWAMTINNLGIAYSDRIKGEKAQNIEEAIACLQQALIVRTFEAFPMDWAMTQTNLGIAYSDRIKGEKAQNIEEAIACYHEALIVYTFEAFPMDWARTQTNLGNAYRNRIKGEKAQNLENAIAYCQQALRVYTYEAFPMDWARTQTNLGNAYRNRIKGEKTQNLEEAIACYQQALRFRTFEAFPIEWAMTQTNLGIAYSDRIEGEKAQNLEEAIACYQQALRFRTFEAFPIEWAMTQTNLGIAYRDRIKGDKAENIEEAIACYQAALQVRTREDFPIDWAETQNHLGNAYRNRIIGQKADNLEHAIACYQLALEVHTREALTQDYLDTINNLAFAYQHAQNLPKAYNAFDDAIKTVEYLREEMIFGSGVEEYKTKLAEEWNKVYQGMVEVCLELGNIREAIEYVERSKTRNLVEQILSRDLNTIFPPYVVTQLEQYRDQIAAGQYQIQHSKAGNSTALAQHLQELRQQRNDLRDHYLPIGSSFNFQQFQNNLDDHTAIVEFYITGDKLLTFIFTRQTQQPIVLQSAPQDLDELVNWRNEYLQSYHTNKSDWQNDLSNRLQLLSQILHIDDIIQQIPGNCDRLILIPHRYLHLLPLHALPINSHHGEGKSGILMDRFPAGVSYAPSCQLLQLVQTRRRPDFTHLFAVQNPTGDLSYTNMEVEVIKSYFNPADTDVLVENAATKAAIDSKPLNTYHCLHFSCHGYFNLNQPQKSALILANVLHSPAPAELNPEQHLPLDNGKVIDLDKCLTLDDIFALKLDQCRLVTLSAPETGLIDYTNTSDEYISLASGFIVAGSKAVVSSLWMVNELSTTLLMIKFYQNLREQMSLAVALNRAQFWLRDITVSQLLAWSKQLPINKSSIRMIKASLDLFEPDEQPFQSPYYWGAFFLIGQ